MQKAAPCAPHPIKAPRGVQDLWGLRSPAQAGLSRKGFFPCWPPLCLLFFIFFSSFYQRFSLFEERRSWVFRCRAC